LSLIGAIWVLAIVLFAGNNLVSSWSTPPGRFLTTISETGMTFMMVIGSILLVLGLAIMGIEYFSKDEANDSHGYTANDSHGYIL